MAALSPEFLLTAFVVCLTPGIAVVYPLSVMLERIGIPGRTIRGMTGRDDRAG